MKEYPKLESNISPDDVCSWMEDGRERETSSAIKDKGLSLPPKPPKPTIHSTDPRLLEELESSDEALREKAWFEFNDRYKRYIHYVAIRSGGNGAMAQELVNEVLERVYKHISKYNREKGKFRNWLWVVTRNLTFDRLRKKVRRNERRLGTAEGENLTGATVSEWWKEVEFEYLVEKALVNVKASFRGKPEKIEIFREYAIGGRRAREVAGMFGVNENVVRMTKNALMPKFKEALKQILHLLLPEHIIATPARGPTAVERAALFLKIARALHELTVPPCRRPGGRHVWQRAFDTGMRDNGEYCEICCECGRTL